MRASVETVFPTYTEEFEGHTTYLYSDVRGLVTCGRGNLVDPMGSALSLPWLNSDGTPASRAQIMTAWLAVKAAVQLERAGGAAYAKLTTIRLSPESVDDLTRATLHTNDSMLAARFPGWDGIPASAQLATHSLAWACGPAFRFPRFEAALARRDWETCAVESQMAATGNPGLVPRNRAQAILFRACATVDPDTVADWHHAADTLRELPSNDTDPDSDPAAA